MCKTIREQQEPSPNEDVVNWHPSIDSITISVFVIVLVEFDRTVSIKSTFKQNKCKQKCIVGIVDIVHIIPQKDGPGRLHSARQSIRPRCLHGSDQLHEITAVCTSENII